MRKNNSKIFLSYITRPHQNFTLCVNRRSNSSTKASLIILFVEIHRTKSSSWLRNNRTRNGIESVWRITAKGLVGGHKKFTSPNPKMDFAWKVRLSIEWCDDVVHRDKGRSEEESNSSNHKLQVASKERPGAMVDDVESSFEGESNERDVLERGGRGCVVMSRADETGEKTDLSKERKKKEHERKEWGREARDRNEPPPIHASSIFASHGED